ncbi:unnamed protein product [Phaeothamnion confervicola]
MCIAITGTGGGSGGNPLPKDKITYGIVVDECPFPGCAGGIGGIDFRRNGDGLWNIDWYPVECPVGGGSFSYSTEGSNPTYLKLQVQGQRVPVSALAIDLNGDGTFLPLDRTPYGDNHWIYNAGSEGTVGGSMDVRVTSIFGDVVVDRGIFIKFDGSGMPGSAQFPDKAGVRDGFDASNPLATAPGAGSLGGGGGGGSLPPPAPTPSTGPAPTPAAPTGPVPTPAAPTGPAPTPAAPTGPAPTVPAPTPALVVPPTGGGDGACSGAWGQCGGDNYSGPTCCVAGYSCSFNSQYYSQCLPSATGGDGDSIVADPGCAARYEQCGGSTFSGPTCCVDGFTCLKSNEFYSQCL